MRVVLLGGAPGVGKSSVAQSLLVHAMGGSTLVQWVDVDALWRHQPWRVDDRTKAMVQSNLQSVIANAEAAGVDILVVTWVFQNAEMHELVQGLAPAGSAIKRIQLLADEVPWRERFDADPARPSIDEFFLDRYSSAQDTPADHRIDTSQMSVAEAADCVADLLGL